MREQPGVSTMVRADSLEQGITQSQNLMIAVHGVASKMQELTTRLEGDSSVEAGELERLLAAFSQAADDLCLAYLLADMSSDRAPAC